MSQGPAGNYTYATQFILPPTTNLSTVSVSGLWGTDDWGLDIEINTIPTGQVRHGFTTLVPFSITSGLQIRLNTIEFLVQNAGGPTGLRVDKIRGDYSLVPEPGTPVRLGGGWPGGNRGDTTAEGGDSVDPRSLRTIATNSSL